MRAAHIAWVVAGTLFSVGCGDSGSSPGGDLGVGQSGPTITITGNAIDPERSTAAKTGNLAALFGPADNVGPCWTEPCDSLAAFDLAKVAGVTISVFDHPEIPSVTSDAKGHFVLPGVPQKSRIRIALTIPNDPIYLQTVDAIEIRTGTVDLKELPFHICRRDKIFRATLDKDPTALDNGAVLGLINDNVPLPLNKAVTDYITVTPSSGKVLYVGFDYKAKSYVVDTDVTMPNYSTALWLGVFVAYGSTEVNLTPMVTDNSPFADSVTGRPYTYPTYTIPLIPKTSTFLLLYPVH